MREIIGYFFNPEESIEELLQGEETKKIRQGILGQLKIIVILALMTVVVYRMMGTKMEDILLIYNKFFFHDIKLVGMNEGIQWISIAILKMVELVLTIGIRVIVWSALLFLVKCVFKEAISTKAIVLIIVISQIAWLVIQILQVGVTMGYLIMPVENIYGIIMGLLSIFEYWYLVLLGIGFTVGCKGTLLKGAGTVLIIQVGLWGLVSLLPSLQPLLG